MTRRRWIAGPVLFALLSGLSARAAPEAPAPTKADARALVRLAHGSLAALGMEARRVREDEARATGSAPRPTPLATAIKRAARALRTAAQGLAAKDARWFEGLAEGQVALAMLRTAHAHVDVRTEAGSRALDDVLAAWSLLRSRFGLSVLRDRRGEALSEKESKRLQAVREAARGLETRVTVLKADTGSRALHRMLDDVLATAHLVAAAPSTGRGWALVLDALHQIEGEWTVASYYVPPRLRPAWTEASSWAGDAFALWRVWSSEAAESLAPVDWSFADEAVDLGWTPTSGASDEEVRVFDAVAEALPEVGPKEHGEQYASTHPEDDAGAAAKERAPEGEGEEPAGGEGEDPEEEAEEGGGKGGP